ncbi:hypothetical protein IT882_09315 [Microbacterium schleiferi]|uniref:DUF559 domain-containing protein n=1 Tax=Microbacterium schleiferi TaxID=69362 RepID=A0A7S8MV41_9MICO|nr:hypothetical protein [Microbacterium schleiferi]QPE03548.1 hypothetical protein IT882_09315 [Microbacterium schleiferi]
MPDPQPLPDTLQGVPFSVSAAQALGVPTRRLRARDLRAPFHGVRERSDRAQDLLSRCLAYSTRASTHVVFAQATAAQLWGLPLPLALEHDPSLHVLHLAGGRAPRGAGVRGSKSSRTVAIRALHGIRLTAPVDTWLGLAATLHLPDLVALGDAIVSGDAPLASIRDIHAGIRDRPGARGIRRAREAASLIRRGSRSRRESLLRVALVDAGLPEPEINAAVELSDGSTYHGDLVFRAHRVVVEYEGDQHRTDDWQWAHDIDRYNRMIASGWFPLRISRRLGFEAAAHVVRETLSTRTASGAHP